ncbi:MAG TPA: methyl-accepting chemotaxis protein, partial [Pseudomonas sp.]|nr:methyl-accepting chemotaxis protein [Pseudomonas sp.]
LRLMLNRDEQSLRANEARAVQLKADLLASQERFERLISTPEERAVYQRFQTAERLYLQEQGKVMQLSQQDLLDEALVVVNGELGQYADSMAAALAELTDLNRSGATRAATHAGEVFYSARTWVLVTMLLAGLATVVLALLLTRSIV